MVRFLRLQLALVACLAYLACAQQAAAATLLVEFTSPDCGPCHAMRPILQRLAAEGYNVRQVDVSTRPDVARQFRVTQWPTCLVLIDGRERARLVGAASRAQLVEMIQRASAMAAAQPANDGGGTLRPAAEISTPAALTAGAGRKATFATRPEEGRIVEIQDPTPPHPSAASLSSRAAVPRAVDPSALIAATVRLTIEDPDGKSTGTGAIVDAREGEALVLTCGHLFRSSGGKGPIEVSLFTPGPNGAEVRKTVAGVLVDFDLERDLALVRFSTDEPVAVTPIAPPGTQVQPGLAVTSVGCDHGANPTPRSTQVTAIDRYLGHPNLEAAGAPVEGRSGGGLFNAQGQLVGVCYAADPQSDEGLYASLPSIYAKFDSLGWSHLYQSSPSHVPTAPEANAAGSQLAAQEPQAPFEVRGQNPTPELASTLIDPLADGAQPFTESSIVKAEPGRRVDVQPAALTPQEQAALEEIQRRGVDSEVICIIRPRTADGRSDVIKLSNASPAFVKALASGREARTDVADRTASPAGQTGAFSR